MDALECPVFNVLLGIHVPKPSGEYQEVHKKQGTIRHPYTLDHRIGFGTTLKQIRQS